MTPLAKEQAVEEAVPDSGDDASQDDKNTKETAQTADKKTNDKEAKEAPKDTVENPAPASEQAEGIREILKTIAEVEAPGPADLKVLSTVFAKAARAVLTNPDVATPETIKAFIDRSQNIPSAEMRAELVSRLGAIAVKYPQYAARILPALEQSLSDESAEVRETVSNGIADLGTSNKELSEKTLKILTNAVVSHYQDVREKAVQGLTALGVAYEPLATHVIHVISAVLAKAPDKQDVARQEYKVRIDAARRLGQLAIAHGSQVPSALKGLQRGLADEELFVRYRVVEALENIATAYPDEKDDVVKTLRQHQQAKNCIWVESGKIDAVLRRLDPPVRAEKTFEELAEEKRRAEEAARKAAEAAKQKQDASRQKAAEEQARKARMDNLRHLANKLPGKKL